MSYRVPTLEELHSFLVAFWKAYFPLSNVGSRFSYHWKRLRVYAGGATDLHAHVKSAQSDVMPDTAQGPFLTRWGGIVGVPKKGATPARKSKALRVYGVAASAVVVGDQLLHTPSGLRFQVIENLAIGVGDVSMDVDVAGIDTGSQTRLSSGETLTFTAPPAGIRAAAKLVLDLDEDGFDAEQDPAYSVRVNDELGMPHAGGTQADFEKWALEVVGVSLAKAYPNRAGVGTMDVVALHAGNGSDRSLTDSERAAVLAHIQTVAPAQVAATNGSLRVLSTTADEQDVEILLTPNGDLAYEMDWNDAAPIVVLAYTSATREVQSTAPLPGALLAGMRVCFGAVASVQDGDVFTVEQITAADKFTVRETPTNDLLATDLVYAAGPLTKPIRDAIVAHMNGEIVYADAGAPLPASRAESKLGLQILADGIGPANPAGVYGTWSGAIILAVLAKIASYPTGARNVEITTPAADYEAVDPPFPGDDATTFIAPGAVLVRKKW